ncbi:MAG: hypothetical protein H0Z32_15910 [Bacillaceae bacterium]|nr:hypothetical protein [Bacillaceae bacterium]
MMKKIFEVKNLYQQLLMILKRERESENSFIIEQIEYSIRIIEENLNNDYNCEDIEKLFKRLKDTYKRINQPKIGLSDYFIWRENYDDRVKANEPLDAIKDNLFRIFNC